ncbi:ribosome maturation protein RimP [Sphingomonas sp. KRR8]|jgi:ribosome maturation factor RimP|uniref:ribosome maturation protein RimP n=1 Tax=Sphingomonas sp. KRR8 TaxID=2942996 RepID=UPI002020E7A0|nr:ribosome maturation protein RimP [Sphingomonas sp. KRR8]URD60989.1 ribosome maturation protein RimP [Sphingomonas sp. KRR8]
MDLNALHDLIEPEAKSLGFDLVRVAMIGGQSDPTLQIMAERPDTRQLDLGDCEALSRRISEKFDALEEAGEDPIDGAYRLEVSSPGIDRPLTRPKDYTDWAGHEARLKLAREVDGAKQVSGTIEEMEGGEVRIASPKGIRVIPFDAIQSAKLLLTDRLIKATAPLSAEGADSILTQED